MWSILRLKMVGLPFLSVSDDVTAQGRRIECLWIKALGILFIFLVSGRVDSQCSPESGKSENVKVHEKSNCFVSIL